ncbi:MAG: hypothetical protein J07HB67_00483, partial [halophilic archaeon J07HB67]
ETDLTVARRTLESYRPYLPWMFRLSVGLPLVGAGFAGYLFSPAVPTSLRILQVALGFLLLFGLATRWVAVVGLGAYLWVLATAWPTPPPWPSSIWAGSWVCSCWGAASPAQTGCCADSE